MKFQLVAHVFCASFLFELVVKIFACRRWRDAFRDHTFCFDFGLVMLIVYETWVVLVIVGMFPSLQPHLSPHQMRGVGIFRVTHALRLARVARIYWITRAMPDLMVLVRGMVSAMKSVFSALLLLFIFICIFSSGSLC